MGIERTKSYLPMNNIVSKDKKNLWIIIEYMYFYLYRIYTTIKLQITTKYASQVFKTIELWLLNLTLQNK